MSDVNIMNFIVSKIYKQHLYHIFSFYYTYLIGSSYHLPKLIPNLYELLGLRYESCQSRKHTCSHFHNQVDQKVSLSFTLVHLIFGSFYVLSSHLSPNVLLNLLVKFFHHTWLFYEKYIYELFFNFEQFYH